MSGTFRLRRQVRIHQDGAPRRHPAGDAAHQRRRLAVGAAPHRELPLAFHDISNDHDTKVVILTGTGAEFSGPRVTNTGHPLFPTRPSMEVVERLLTEGKQGLLNFLDIERANHQRGERPGLATFRTAAARRYRAGRRHCAVPGFRALHRRAWFRATACTLSIRCCSA